MPLDNRKHTFLHWWNDSIEKHARLQCTSEDRSIQRSMYIHMHAHDNIYMNMYMHMHAHYKHILFLSQQLRSIKESASCIGTKRSASSTAAHSKQVARFEDSLNQTPQADPFARHQPLLSSRVQPTRPVWVGPVWVVVLAAAACCH